MTNSLPWLDIPIVQAPIGSAAGATLCAAVSNCGALGGIALTWRDRSEATKLVAAVRALTDHPFYANFVLHFEPRCLRPALDAGVPAVTFSWGDPGAYILDVRSAGALLGLQAVSGDSAMKMLEYEPDFLIVQGTDAGGHVQAHEPLDRVLREVLAASGNTPVFAAGGLATGPDLARVMSSGASGGVFGTRFVACLESEAHEIYKSALIAASASDTVLTTCFDGGWPQAAHRVLRNSTFVEWDRCGSPSAGRRPGENDVLGVSASGDEMHRYDDAMPRCDTQGDLEAMCLYAGTSVDGIRSLATASEIVSSIWSEAQRLLNPRS